MSNYSVILSNMGLCSDRFMTVGYGKKYSVSELFERLNKIDGVSGVELIGGSNITKENLSEIKEFVDKYSLKVVSLIPDHFGRRIWGKGAFTSPDPNVRKAAIDETCSMIDMANELDCDLINIWNGQDGYDYPMQVDYERTHEWLAEGLRKCAIYDKDTRISLEYKPKEPRNHSYISNVHSTLLLIDEIDMDNIGVTIDTGHSLVASENISEAVSAAVRKGKLFHMHINDNYRVWDDDMITGSVHTIEFIELFYWLKRLKYSGWMSVDQYPYREDSVKAMKQTISWIYAFESAAKRIDDIRAERIFSEQDSVESSALMQELIFGKGQKGTI